MNIEQLLQEPRIPSSLIHTGNHFGSLVALVGLLITTNAI